MVDVATFLEAFYGGLPDLGLLSSTAKVAGFPESRHSDSKDSIELEMTYYSSP